MDRASMLINFPGLLNCRVPGDAYMFFDDFITPQWGATGVAVQTNWKLSDIGTLGQGTVANLVGTADTPNTGGGVISITTLGTAGDGCNLQVPGSAFHLEDGYPLYWESRWYITDISNTGFFNGLATVDAEIIAGGMSAGGKIGFQMLEAGSLTFITSTTTDIKTTTPVYTEADAKWVRGAFLWDGIDSIYVYIDDDDDGEFDHVSTIATSTAANYVLLDAFVNPTIEAVNQTTASAEVVLVDYVLCAQQRYKS